MAKNPRFADAVKVDTFPVEAKLTVGYMPDNTVFLLLDLAGLKYVESGQTLVAALVRLTKMYFPKEQAKNLFFYLCVQAGVSDIEMDSAFAKGNS